MTGFAVVKGGINDSGKTSWLEHCKRATIPCVTVHKRVKLADIYWDADSFHPTVEDQFWILHGDMMKNAVINALKQHCGNKKCLYFITPTCIWIKDIDISSSEVIASELYNLAETAVRQHPRLKAIAKS